MPARTDYDVVIVGGGPAGALAGINLAGRGLKVVLLDAGSFPRDKACGGGISSRMLERFPYLRRPLESIPVNAVNKVYLESPDGTSLREERDAPLYLMIRRLEFDALLVRQCREAGLEVREGTRVSSLAVDDDGVSLTTGSGAPLRAKLVLGADGVNSVVARDAGLNCGWSDDQVAVDMMEETACCELGVQSSDTMYVYYGLSYMHGYGYVFPKRGHVNLGVGVLLSAYRKDKPGAPYDGHRAFVSRLKETGVVTGASRRENFHGFRIPVAGPLARTYCRRILLLGDAAGFVNAFTGEGIYFAMASGEHAARAALEAFKRGRFDVSALSLYESLWKAEFAEELAQSVAIQRTLFADGGRIDLIVRAAKDDPELRRSLTDYATGQVPASAIKRKVLVRLLPAYLKDKLRQLGRKFAGIK